MNSLISFFLLLTFAATSSAQENVLIVGKVVDQNGQPLSDVKVRLSLTGGVDHKTVTDINGLFTFKNIPRDYSYIIGGKKDKYLSKTEIYGYDQSKSKDTAHILFSLRERAGATIKTSKVGKADLGMTIQEAINKFKIDTTEAILQNEPPGVARGIKAELGDSTIIYLQINRKESFLFDFKHILNEKVVGIGLAFTNCKIKHWGTGFVWWGISNPYCKPKE